MPGSNNQHKHRSIARRRAQDIANQFPGTLSDSEQEEVAQRIERLFRAIEDVRSYPLQNGDEPAPVFRPIGKEQP
jgi:hypothetical protein